MVQQYPSTNNFGPYSTVDALFARQQHCGHPAPSTCSRSNARGKKRKAPEHSPDEVDETQECRKRSRIEEDHASSSSAAQCYSTSHNACATANEPLDDYDKFWDEVLKPAPIDAQRSRLDDYDFWYELVGPASEDDRLGPFELSHSSESPAENIFPGWGLNTHGVENPSVFGRLCIRDLDDEIEDDIAETLKSPSAKQSNMPWSDPMEKPSFQCFINDVALLRTVRASKNTSLDEEETNRSQYEDEADITPARRRGRRREPWIWQQACVNRIEAVIEVFGEDAVRTAVKRQARIHMLRTLTESCRDGQQGICLERELLTSPHARNSESDSEIIWNETPTASEQETTATLPAVPTLPRLSTIPAYICDDAVDLILSGTLPRVKPEAQGAIASDLFWWKPSGQ